MTPKNSSAGTFFRSFSRLFPKLDFFMHFGCPLAPFWFNLAHFGSLLAPFWLHFAPFWLLLGSLLFPFGSFLITFASLLFTLAFIFALLLSFTIFLTTFHGKIIFFFILGLFWHHFWAISALFFEAFSASIFGSIFYRFL